MRLPRLFSFLKERGARCLSGCLLFLFVPPCFYRRFSVRLSGVVYVQPIRFKETDDLAHRVLHLMDSQLVKMHTRLRDGTCIPVMGLYILDVVDKPTPLHQCMVRLR